jgi:hypothetical protein
MVLPETMAQPAGEEAAIVATEMGSSAAPVTLDGKVLFRVSGISVYPAEQRARAGTTLAVMTPAAFQEFARAAAAVLEARLEDQHLREGLGLVFFGSVQAFGPAEARPLPRESISVLRQVL